MEFSMIASFEGLRQYLAGERVSCVVTMKCPDEAKNNPKVEQVALHAVAVQLVGVFTYNEQWCAPPYVAPQKKNRKELFPPVLLPLGSFQSRSRALFIHS